MPSSAQIASASSPNAPRMRARAPAPRRRARGRRTARGRTAASRRSRRGSARRRWCGRRARRRSRPAARPDRRAGCWPPARPGRSRAAAPPGSCVDGPAREGADRLAQLARPADAVALPERHGAGRARRRRDHHPVARDLLDAPGRGAEQEHLARGAPRRPSLRPARRRGGRPAGKTPKRPRSGMVPALAIASARAPGRARIVPASAVPHDPRPQLGELLGRIRPASMSSTFSSWRRSRSRVGPGAPHQREQVVDRDARRRRRRRHGDDLLRQHVERVAGHDASSRSGPRACGAPRRRSPAGRRGTWGRCGPWRRRPRRGPRGRCAAGRASTDLGDSTCTTRSTAPMSMPSSSDEVATRRAAGRVLSWSSITQPLLARERAVVGAARATATGSSAASSLRRSARRSAERRLLTKMRVERCSRTSSSSSG